MKRILCISTVLTWLIHTGQWVQGVSAFEADGYMASAQLLNDPIQLFTRDDRPKDCPPCFNCHLDDFVCHQFANCSSANGRCDCPSGFGGDSCSEPTCGSLADGKDRKVRDGKQCACDSGWSGINCNVCETDEACRALIPDEEGAVCLKEGLAIKYNYEQCDITNQKILDQLKGQKPQATFACDALNDTCNFQFWIDARQSFYCGLDHCEGTYTTEPDRNITKYECENVACRCIPGRMLCGEHGSVDIGEFLETVKGPGTFTSTRRDGKESSVFSEPAMNQLISSIFADSAITLNCRAGECVHKTEVPGYVRPIKKINTPLIAGVIAGTALFLVAVVLIMFWFRRRSYSTYGPIRITDDDEEENAKLLADHKPATLSFRNVSYRLGGKHILANVQGLVRPGEVLAIMGASGAGKTTFLDILARKNKRGTVEGDFYVNGEKVLDEEFRSIVGFVDQEDTLLPTLTVHETIMDSALLRLPRDMSRASKEQKVEDVERQLGIYHIRHQIIGSEEGDGRGISGGEKRRVGIACELVTSPSILYCDEPTSGLDAFNAFNVIECLVNLAKNYNRTVVFTIHQPRSNIVALFDNLILLAKGRTVYSGSFRSCQDYFDQIGYSCPPGFNIADYLVDLTMHAARVHPPIDDDHLFVTTADSRFPTSRTSSAIAIKSVASVSNISMGRGSEDRERDSTETERLMRPGTKRKSSIKQKQDRELFTRKKAAAESQSPRTDDEASLPEADQTQTWLRLSRQNGVPPPHSLDDPDNLPPPATGDTGTDLDILVGAYMTSEVASSMQEDIQSAASSAANANGTTFAHANGQATAGRIKGYEKAGRVKQFIILSVRTWRNIYRNPMLMLTHYAIAIVLAVFIGFLFYGLTDDIKGFQNRLGMFFFLLALFGFSTLTSLTVFAPERLLFVRERAKGYYSPLSYFAAKVVFDIVPLRLLPPVIMSVIAYPMTGLLPQWGPFLKFVLILVLFNFAAATVCLCIGIVFKNAAVANLIGSLVMLFSLLFAGFLLNSDSIGSAAWLQQLSIFHFGFESLIVNEVRYLSLVDHKYGLNIEVPGAAILSSFGFDVLALWTDVIGLGIYCAVFIVLAYTAMHFLLVEKR